MPMGDVSVRESNAPLERILNNVFTKRGFRYKIVDRTVVLTSTALRSRSGRTA